jgi:hypothetical protein
MPPLRAVMHGYQIKDLADEINGGLRHLTRCEARAHGCSERASAGASSTRKFTRRQHHNDFPTTQGRGLRQDAIVWCRARAEDQDREEPHNVGGGVSRGNVDVRPRRAQPGQLAFRDLQDATAPTARVSQVGDKEKAEVQSESGLIVHI